MRIFQQSISSSEEVDEMNIVEGDLVLGFGAKSLLEDESIYSKLRLKFPSSKIVLCSSSGEIHKTTVSDGTLSIMAVNFESTKLRSNSINRGDFKSSADAGRSLVSELPQENLQYILIIADGSLVNGSELVRGIQGIIPSNIPITGGLAGDGANFNYTLVGLDEQPTQGNIVAIGFYGTSLKVSHASFGGWEAFGLVKEVSKSTSNELFEIENKNALEIYKKYLGNYASDLPSSALLFPLAIQLEAEGEYLVRTILSIDEEKQSMTFAGDIPIGSKVRFMRANFDRLVDAASTAAKSSLSGFDEIKPEWALLISCVGRKLVLGNRTEEEIEAVAEVLGEQVPTTGFYSYGEISPLNKGGSCELHNQTMTITCFQEI